MAHALRDKTHRYVPTGVNGPKRGAVISVALQEGLLWRTDHYKRISNAIGVRSYIEEIGPGVPRCVSFLQGAVELTQSASR
ncbi:hypothetical protein M0804_000840 [Polistes exclamans]|nr:hypothetical protein M0804_000840 [Polistes exclamans]